MTPEQITDLLKKRGANLSEVARTLNVSHTSVRRVVHGTSKSRRVANTIAIFLGHSVDELWPGQYPAKYQRVEDATRKQLQVAANLASRKAA